MDSGRIAHVMWTCPKCDRVFRQINQAHSCGIGSRAELLAGKPPELAKLFRELEKSLRNCGEHEIVFRGRYALLRTTRIFADVVFMRDCLRLAIVLGRRIGNEPMFFKIQAMSTHRVGHVAKLRSAADLRKVEPYLNEAHRLALDS
jgi:hypothetical protein